jgi:hypothetical protein
MVVEFMNGLMEEGMMENGKITICMERVFIPGKMVGNMKVTILMIENMATEYIHGRMADNTLDNGRMESNTVRVLTDKQLDRKKEAIGKMEKELNGLNLDTIAYFINFVYYIY